MIPPDQLAAALERLAPRDWEVLDLSLRRRVPDEALAKIFDCEASEVARRRASAIEHLADDLGVQRGEDLGSVLKALLEQGTWDSADRPAAKDGGNWKVFADEEGEPGEGEDDSGDEPEPGEKPEAEDKPPKAEPPELKTSEAARLFRLPAAPPPEPEEPPAPPAEAPEKTEEPAPVAAAAATPEAGARTEPPPVVADAEDLAQSHGPARPHVTGRSGGKPAPAVGAAGNDPPREREPVLDMLADREQERRRERVRTPLLWAIGGGLAAACLFGAGFLGATQFGDEAGRDEGGGNDAPRRFVPDQRGPLAAPFPSDPNAASCYPTAYVRRAVRVHQRPGSRRTLRLPARTEWGSARVFSIVRRSGSWLAVQAPELKNGEVGWIRSEGTQQDCVRWSLHADLSRRLLFVRRDGRTVRRLGIAIGSARHPTPKGRFAVTDKLKVADKGSPYGCCVLALTGHQTDLPRDWPGGDRLAVHATSDVSSIGKRVSLGCMRSRPKEVDWLIRTVPLGAPIFIRA